MILEGIVTTVSSQCEINIAPMGPLVGPAMDRLLLRPFRTAHTYRNLKDHGEGVFHVTDDVLLLAQTALGKIEPWPRLFPTAQLRGHVLGDCCRYYDVRVQSIDHSDQPSRIEAEVMQ